MRRSPLPALVVATALIVGGAAFVRGAGSERPPHAKPTRVQGLEKIKHIVMIFQENRSFDTYFGTYPRADGIPSAPG